MVRYIPTNARYHTIIVMEHIYTLTNKFTVIFTDNRTSNIIEPVLAIYTLLSPEKTVFFRKSQLIYIISERQDESQPVCSFFYDIVLVVRLRNKPVRLDPPHLQIASNDSNTKDWNLFRSYLLKRS